MTSIKEVARLANVSPATVSRVMNGTAKVDPEKKERVMQVIQETGFVPNAVARSLFKKSAKIIGFILPSIENPFFTRMANAIEKTADANGYRLVLCNTDNDVEKEKGMIQMLASMHADGIIMTGIHEEVIPIMDKCGIPIVITDRRLDKDTKNNYVRCDHYEGGRMAAKHLIECGCKNIVCIKGLQSISSAKARYEGYLSVCKEMGVQEQSITCAYDFDEGLKVAEKILQRYPEVDGIIACNDMVAISVYKVLHGKGISVPEQIQIIGFDNIALAKLVTPGLTTIAQPIDAIGRKAAELIIHKDDYMTEQKEYVLDAELVKRETTRYGRKKGIYEKAGNIKR